MTWRFQQSTGDFWHDGEYEGRGYSGHGAGVNNPALQNVAQAGPIPVGLWKIASPITHPHLGILAFPLSPLHGTETFGRSGFFIHGDNSLLNMSGSEGCIILGRAIRAALAHDVGDNTLEVVA